MKTFSLIPAALFAAWLASAPALVEDAPLDAVQVEDDAELDADTLLSRIEERTAELETLRCRIRYTRTQGLLGDSQQRFGDFYYRTATDDDPTRLAINLDRLNIDGRGRPIEEWYIFDGNWLLERNHDDMTATRRELVPPGRESGDTLSLGEGSVPIPMRINKAEILASYDVEKLEDEPLGDTMLYHLRLTPRQDAEGEGEDEAQPLDLWFDAQTLLLSKVESLDGDDAIELLFSPSQMRPNVEIDAGVFSTELPSREDGWDVQEVPLQ